MSFIKKEAALVALAAAPFHQLLDAHELVLVAALLLRDEIVRRKNHALLEIYRRVILPILEVYDLDLAEAQIPQIAFRVFDQISGARDPDVALAAEAPVVRDDAG